MKEPCLEIFLVSVCSFWRGGCTHFWWDDTDVQSWVLPERLTWTLKYKDAIPKAKDRFPSIIFSSYVKFRVSIGSYYPYTDHESSPLRSPKKAPDLWGSKITLIPGTNLTVEWTKLLNEWWYPGWMFFIPFQLSIHYPFSSPETDIWAKLGPFWLQWLRKSGAIFLLL